MSGYPILRLGMAAALVAALCQPSAHAQTPTSSLEGLPDEVMLQRFNLTRRWYVQIPLLRIREKVVSLKVLDGILFVQSDQGMFHSLDAETGQLFWSQTVSGLGTTVYPPAITPEFIYVTSGKSLMQLERKSGRIRWIKELPAAASAGPAANRDFVYVPTTDKRLYAIALRDDHERKFTRRPIAWFYQTSGYLNNAPIVLGDRVVFSSSDGIIYAANLDARRFYYRYYTYTPSAAPLSTLHRWLYIATTDYNLYCVDLLNGETRWLFPSGYPILQKPLPFLEDVFVIPDGFGLYCLNNASGDIRWLNQQVSRLIAVSGEHVYAVNRLNDMLILSRKTGEKVGAWPADQFQISTDNQYNDRVYLATEDGLIVCLHEQQNKEPRIHVQTPEGEKTFTEIAERVATKADVKQPARASDDAAKKAKSSFFDDTIVQEMEKEKAKPSAPSFFGAEKKAEETKEAAPAKKAKSFFDD